MPAFNSCSKCGREWTGPNAADKFIRHICVPFPPMRSVDIRGDDHEPVNSTQVERDFPQPTTVKQEIDDNYRKAMYGEEKYDPNNDPWP